MLWNFITFPPAGFLPHAGSFQAILILILILEETFFFISSRGLRRKLTPAACLRMKHIPRQEVVALRVTSL